MFSVRTSHGVFNLHWFHLLFLNKSSNGSPGRKHNCIGCMIIGTCLPPQPMKGTIWPYLYWDISWDTYFSNQILWWSSDHDGDDYDEMRYKSESIFFLLFTELKRKYFLSGGKKFLRFFGLSTVVSESNAGHHNFSFWGSLFSLCSSIPFSVRVLLIYAYPCSWVKTLQPLLVVIAWCEYRQEGLLITYLMLLSICENLS